MNSRKQIRIAVVLFLVVFLAGVAGFKIFGGPEWSFLDSVYMTAVTIATAENVLVRIEAAGASGSRLGVAA